nr:MAG TPA: hypothetical protein [Caudoviricetes sp.]
MNLSVIYCLPEAYQIKELSPNLYNLSNFVTYGSLIQYVIPYIVHNYFPNSTYKISSLGLYTN